MRTACVKNIFTSHRGIQPKLTRFCHNTAKRLSWHFPECEILQFWAELPSRQSAPGWNQQTPPQASNVTIQSTVGRPRSYGKYGLKPLMSAAGADQSHRGDPSACGSRAVAESFGRVTRGGEVGGGRSCLSWPRELKVELCKFRHDGQCLGGRNVAYYSTWATILSLSSPANDAVEYWK